MMWLGIHLLLIAALFFCLRKQEKLTALFWAAFIHVLTLASVSQIAVVMGKFQWANVLIATAVLDLVAGAILFFNQSKAEAPFEKKEFWGVLAIVLGFGIFNATFATYYVRSGRDYG